MAMDQCSEEGRYREDGATMRRAGFLRLHDV